MVIFVKKMTTTHEVLMNTAKINKFVNNCTDKHGFFLCYATPAGGSYCFVARFSRVLQILRFAIETATGIFFTCDITPPLGVSVA